MHWIFWVVFTVLAVPLVVVLTLAYLFWTGGAIGDLWSSWRPGKPLRIEHETCTWLVIHTTLLAIVLLAMLPGVGT